MDDDDITVMRSSHSHPPELPRGAQGEDAGANALPFGTRLGEFEITGLIGEGGFGIVYLARDTSLDRLVAIKEFMPAGMAARSRTMHVTVRSQHHVDTFKVGLRSFVNEARMLARFDSPALVKVYRFWEANGTAYMVMPFYEGVTLRQALKDSQVVPDEHWLRALLASLFDALETIHREQCYHRDIAPDNILILRDGRPLLLDFGAARRVVAGVTQGLTVILKPGFAPIEQYADTPGMRQGPWTDVYALAAVVYFVISGKTPLPAVARLVSDELPPAREVGRGRYSERLLAAIDQALEVRPEKRIQNIAQFRQALGLEEGLPRTMPGIGDAPLPTTGSMPRWSTEAPRASQGRTGPGPQAALPDDWGRTEFRPAPDPQPKRGMAPFAIGGVVLAVLVAAAVVGYQWTKSPAGTGATDAARAPEPAGAPPAVAPAQDLPVAAAAPERAPAPAPAPAVQDKPAAAPAPAEPVAVAPPPQPDAAAGPAVAAPARPSPAIASEAAPAKAAPDPDDELWRVATLKDTPAAYDAYLKRFPRGRHAASAQVMLDSRQAKATAPSQAPAAPPLAQGPAGPAAAAVPNAGPAQRVAEPAAPAAKAEVAQQAGGSRPAPTDGKAAAPPPLSPLPPAQVAGPSAAQGAQAAPPAAQAATPPRAQDAPATAQAAAQPPAPPPAGKEPAAADTAKKEPPKEELTAALTPPPGGASRTIRLSDQVLTGDFTQDPVSGFVSGTGQVVWNNGNRYEGRLVKGVREGKGRFTWSDGLRYSGDWVADAPNGRGILEFGNGDRYEGEVKNGAPHGQGTMRFRNGDQYTGAWLNGNRQGQGTMRFANGAVYTGTWSNGQQDGQGTLKFASGDSYAGHWLNGKHHGQGRYTWVNGTYWEGEFRDDRSTENGKTVFPDGRTEMGAAAASTAR